MAERRPTDPVRMPVGPSAQLRRDLRRLGVRRGASRWGIAPDAALRIAAGIAAPRAAVVAVLARVLDEVRRG